MDVERLDPGRSSKAIRDFDKTSSPQKCPRSAVLVDGVAMPTPPPLLLPLARSNTDAISASMVIVVLLSERERV